MEALDAAEQGSAGMQQSQHRDITGHDLPFRLDNDAGDVVDTAGVFTVDNKAEAFEDVEAGHYVSAKSADTLQSPAPGMEMRIEHSIDDAETSTIKDAAMDTVDQFSVAADNNTTTSPTPRVTSEVRAANVDDIETSSFPTAEAAPPIPFPATKMSKKDRKKAEKARRKEEAAYIGEDWWMGSTPAVPLAEAEKIAAQTDRTDMHLMGVRDVEVQASDLPHESSAEAQTAESGNAQESGEPSMFDAALAATLDDAGFDPSLLAHGQQHEQHDQQTTGSALDEDDNAARRRAESVERRRSRRSSSQSLRLAAPETETAVQKGGGKSVATSFEEVVASTLAMAGFDTGHLGGETLAPVGEGENEREGNVETDEAPTATGYVWKTGVKILSLLGAGAVVDKTARTEAASVADNGVEREGLENGTGKEQTRRTRETEDAALMHAETMASELQESASFVEAPHQSPAAVIISRSLLVDDHTTSSTDQQEHNDFATGHKQPVPAATWSFDNIKPAHGPSHIQEDTARPRLSTILELEQAQKADDHDEVQILEKPFSAQATAARIFSNPRSPRTSFVASMRTPQGDAVQSLNVHRQRIPSGSGSETANTRRQAVRQERRDISPAAHLSPYHSPAASNISISSAPRSITPILRRTDRKLSGDLRALSRGSRDGEDAQTSLSESKPKSVVGGLTTSAVGERLSDVDKLYDPLRGSGSGRMSELSVNQQQQQQHVSRSGK